MTNNDAAFAKLTKLAISNLRILNPSVGYINNVLQDAGVRPADSYQASIMTDIVNAKISELRKPTKGGIFK